METQGRVSKWDNLKCVLIILVVVGHFANQFTSDSEIMKMISLFIYTFHMPLFIFLSGLLERHWTKKHPFKWKKPLYYVALGYTLKILIYLLKISFGKHPDFNAFSDTGIPWYMFAMAAFAVVMYLIKDLDWRLLLPMSVIFACLVGYVPTIGSFLSLSRIIVFFPFYYLGYLLNPQELFAFSEKLWVKELSLAVVISTAVVCIVEIDDLYSYIRLLTARNPYSQIHVNGCGFDDRFAFFIVAFLVGWAVLNLIPEHHFKLMSYIGRNTIQIYFWHRLILYVMMYSGFVDEMQDDLGRWWMIAYFMIAVIMTVLLSSKWFAYPLNWMRKIIYA